MQAPPVDARRRFERRGHQPATFSRRPTEQNPGASATGFESLSRTSPTGFLFPAGRYRSLPRMELTMDFTELFNSGIGGIVVAFVWLWLIFGGLNEFVL